MNKPKKEMTTTQISSEVCEELERLKRRWKAMSTEEKNRTIELAVRTSCAIESH